MIKAPRVPWYRVSFVWLLLALPLTAVVGGLATAWLAVVSDDGLVVDDYYRQGKEINRVLRRDQAAAVNGVSARAELRESAHELRIALKQADAVYPTQLHVRLWHATQQGRDRELLLPRHADGSYRAPLRELAPGRYYLQLSAADWRLIAPVAIPGDTAVDLAPLAR